MHESTAVAIIVLSILCILTAAASLIITAWRTGGLQHDLRVMKRNVRKIVRQIHSDIHVAIHN